MFYFLFCLHTLTVFWNKKIKKILGHHKAHGRFSLLRKNNTDEMNKLVQRINN